MLVLDDGDARDALTPSVGDLAVSVGEASGEGDGDVLLDGDASVRTDLGSNVRRDEVVRLRQGSRCEDQCCESRSDDRQREAAQCAKSTRGGSRWASSSTSKNSRMLKPKGPASMAPGKV